MQLSEAAFHREAMEAGKRNTDYYLLPIPPTAAIQYNGCENRGNFRSWNVNKSNHL